MPSGRKRRGVADNRKHTGEYSSPACFVHEFEGPEGAPNGLAIKRIYDPPERRDGFRVLVDRLWPRGLSRERAAIDAWLTELAPSTALRRWFHHDPARWTEFRRRYRAELHAQTQQLQALRTRAAKQRVTLLYGARDERINHAIVLRDLLRKPSRARTRKP